MSIRHIILILIAAMALTGCAATPQLQMTANGMSASVKAEAPIVMSVAFSPVGQSLAFGSLDFKARVWDLKQAKQIRIFEGTSIGSIDVAYTPDGKKLAIASPGLGDSTTIWDIASGNMVKKYDGIGRDEISFTPDGKLMQSISMGFSDTTADVVDVETGHVVRSFENANDYCAKITPDGRHLVIGRNERQPGFLNVDQFYYLGLYDIQTGQQVWKTKIEGLCADDGFTEDGRQLLFVAQNNANMSSSLDLLDVSTGKVLKKLNSVSYEDSINDAIGNLALSPDGKFFVTGNQGAQYSLWDMDSGKKIRKFKTPVHTSTLANVFPSATFSPDGNAVAISSEASVRLFNVSTGQEVATLIGFKDGEWLITTPSGYYNSSAKGDQYYVVKVDGKPYSISQLRESFYRPDLVKLALAGNTLSGFRKLADIKQPPAINIVDTPSSVTTDQVAVSLQVKDQGGGIGDVRLYRNGTAVVLEKTRNLQVTSTTEGGQVLHYTVSLEPGKNTIRAIAFNGDNTMQSTDATIDIDARIAARQPALYAVVVGIQNFENPRLDLSYSVADAKLFADTLEQHGNGLYSAVHIHRLLMPKETTKDALIAALTEAQKEVKPEDLFVFYVASHGTVDDGQYLLITSNVGSTNYAKLKQEALSQDQLKDMISNIAASKKLVVLDTCDAGKMGDALQVALLTRGMSDDTAMNILSRAVGSTILSAATSDQEAVEGYKGHGLFTYVVSQGLGGAADENHDGFVKTLELADYVDSTVPDLAMSVFRHKQYPIVSPTGEGFPLAKVSQ